MRINFSVRLIHVGIQAGINSDNARHIKDSFEILNNEAAVKLTARAAKNPMSHIILARLARRNAAAQKGT
jgi:hypothetical protein